MINVIMNLVFIISAIALMILFTLENYNVKYKSSDIINKTAVALFMVSFFYGLLRFMLV